VDDDSSGRDNEICDVYSGSGMDSPVTDITLFYGGSSKTYYGRLVATDSSENSTNHDFTFTLTNTQPSPPSSASLDGQTTSDTTPTITFTKGTDSDSSPADTVTQYVSVDSSGYTDSGNTYTTSGDIDQFTVTPELSDGTYYVRQWADDGTGATNSRSSDYEYTFTVSAQIIVESVQIEPDENDPGTVIYPHEDSNRTVNVTVTVTNSTGIDECDIRIFNSTESYSSPVKQVSGVIQNCGATCECFGGWDMEYWRNPGQWNVSVDINVTNGAANFTSENFTYEELTALIVNTSTITFSGVPGQTVNSSDAYPLQVKNAGNVAFDVELNGTDFTGLSNSSYVVGVGNSTYNETDTGSFRELSHTYTQIFSGMVPTETREIYFRTYLPIGFISQNYQNSIEFAAQ